MLDQGAAAIVPSSRGSAIHAPHARGVDDVLAALDTTVEGLSEAEARRRRDEYGPNAPPQHQRTPVWMRFLRQFHHVLIYVLIGSAVVTFLLDHLIDTAVILAVVFANAIIGFLQEGKAEKAMDAIQTMLSPHANVFRDGQRRSIDAVGLVPGDLVFMETGDKVPADVRLIEASGFQIQEAALTGESVPVEKSTGEVVEAAALGDRLGMAFSGTMATSGQAKGIVTATGAETEIGRISGLIGDVKTLTTPLLAQINGFAKWLTLMILIIAGLLLAFGVFVQDQPFDDTFMVVVGLSVAAIPEGLPAVLTITMAIGVQAMAKRHAIVRRLPAIETLGSVSVICTDKTGTLTRNEMVVTAAFAGGRRFAVSGEGYGDAGEITDAETGAATSPPERFVQAAILCNDAAIVDGENGPTVSGDPMEGALLAFGSKATSIGDQIACAPRTGVIPFDARYRYMATRNTIDGEEVVFIKGAPEAVMDLCNDMSGTDGPEAFDRESLAQLVDELAKQGQRVLALAVLEPAPKGELKSADLAGKATFLGFVGLIDPPRPEAVSAVAECQGAGISVKMITGDHAGTASAIAREIGLSSPARVLTGAELDKMDDAALRSAAVDTNVFARTSPEHKMRLVEALQAQDLIVAMTGDGVNDAPALKRADVGVAMGQKGTEAAKEAASIVLADDNFASIAAAVREGRTVHDNIKKVISWLLPTNGGEALLVVVALLFAMAPPITALQILWINLVTDVVLGVALAFEPTEKLTMARQPRQQKEPILGGELVWQIVFVSVLFFAVVFGVFRYVENAGYSFELARTMAVNTLVVLQIFYLFYVRNIYGTSLNWNAIRGTRVVWTCVASVTVAQFLFTYAPPLQGVFGTEPVALKDGLLIVALGAVFFAILELEKQMRLLVRAHTVSVRSA